MTRPPRLVVADDQSPIRAGFAMILQAKGIEIVAEAADGNEAVAAVHLVRSGDALLAPAITRRLVERFAPHYGGRGLAVYRAMLASA